MNQIDVLHASVKLIRVDLLRVYYLHVYTSTTSLYLNIITLMWINVFFIFYIFRQNLSNFNNKIIQFTKKSGLLVCISNK